MYLYADYCFGPHGYMLWPQPYIPEYPHLGAIPTKPIDLYDPLSIIWWNLTHTDFISSSGAIVDGIGQLLRTGYSKLEEMKKKLEE